MSVQPSKVGVIASLLVTVVLGAGAQAVLADTIHFKNGRVMKVDSARIEGDEVVFQFAGNEARIPKALVDKIVKDEAVASPTPAGDDEGTRAPIVPSPSEPPVVAEPAAEKADDAASDRDEVEAAAPATTREYWQQKVRDIATEQADIDAQIETLRREERAFLFSHRSTDATTRQIEAAQERRKELDQALKDLRREARRKSIPAGWLRVRGT